jgi:hypothetical protein
MNGSPPGRLVTRIKRAVMYPTRDEQVEIPGAEIANAGADGGLMVVVQALPDGTIRRWINVPCMLEHERPSGLVAPGGRV